MLTKSGAKLLDFSLAKPAIEIADALEKAHRAGVVHRDPLSATAASGTGGSSSASVFAAALTQTMPAPSPVVDRVDPIPSLQGPSLG